MANLARATRAMTEIVKRYPLGTASLFTGAGIKARPTGKNLMVALKRGDITARDLFNGTLGADYDDFNPASTVNMGVMAANANAAPSKAQAGTKFENVINQLFSTANQAADIYAKFKNPGAPIPGFEIQPGAGANTQEKKTPWGIIAAGAGVVIILVVVLFMLKKK